MSTEIFFDTEFSDLAADAELISLGAVAPNGQEFYVELIPQPVCASEFVKEHVLPLLDNTTNSACARTSFPTALADWLADFPEPTLISDSSWDIYHLRKSLGLAAVHHPGVIRLTTSNGSTTEVGLITLPPMGDAALEIYDAALADCFARDPRQHHALVDARALAAAAFAIKTQRAS